MDCGKLRQNAISYRAQCAIYRDEVDLICSTVILWYKSPGIGVVLFQIAKSIDSNKQVRHLVKKFLADQIVQEVVLISSFNGFIEIVCITN